MGRKMRDNCKLPQPCVPEEVVPLKEPTPAFDLCVGDYSLHWDGTHLTHSRKIVTPDGTYGSITLHDGCVVAYGDCEIPTYTPPYCNPNPLPCGEGVGTGGGTGGGTVTVSPTAGNHLKQDPFGLFAKTYLSGGTGITVSGEGTQQRPYTIALQGNADGNSGTEATIVGSGAIDAVTRNGVTYISLKSNGVTAGKYGPLTINEQGVVTAIDEAEMFLTSKNLQVSRELTLQGIDTAQLELADSSAAGTHRFGGYDVTVSQGGRVTQATRVSDITGGNYKIGAYTITLDNYGGITGIEQDEAPAEAGEFKTLDGRTVKYDETGRITSVGETGRIMSVDGTQRDVSAQGPIQDVWVLTHSFGGKSLQSFWGNSVDALGNNDDHHTAHIQLPAYITRAEQVELHRNGARIREEHLDIANKLLTIRFTPSSIVNDEAVVNTINIVLRG